METFTFTGNYSRTDAIQILEWENKVEVERLIPLIVYLVVISVTGIMGNGLVCYIYYPQCNISSSRWFIFFIAVVDLLLCVTVIPIEIATTFQQLNFSNVSWCKFTAFLNVWTLLSLGLILVIVAIDRYRKVCTPLGWQINTFKSKMLCIVAVVSASVISIPTAFVYKIHDFKLRNYNVTGQECSFRKENGGFSAEFIYLCFGLFLFICSLLTICVLYCCIGVAIKKHINRERTSRHQTLSPTRKPSSNNQYSVDLDDASGPTLNTLDEESNDNVFTVNNAKQTIENSMNRKSKSMRLKRARARKATFSISLISLAFVICYLPFLILILMRNVISNFQEIMSDDWRIIYKFFLRSFFLCCAINPFIYGFSDPKFRRSCNHLRYSMKRIFCYCGHSDSHTVNIPRNE